MKKVTRFPTWNIDMTIQSQVLTMNVLTTSLLYMLQPKNEKRPSTRNPTTSWGCHAYNNNQWFFQLPPTETLRLNFAPAKKLCLFRLFCKSFHSCKDCYFLVKETLSSPLVVMTTVLYTIDIRLVGWCWISQQFKLGGGYNKTNTMLWSSLK